MFNTFCSFCHRTEMIDEHQEQFEISGNQVQDRAPIYQKKNLNTSFSQLQEEEKINQAQDNSNANNPKLCKFDYGEDNEFFNNIDYQEEFHNDKLNIQDKVQQIYEFNTKEHQNQDLDYILRLDINTNVKSPSLIFGQEQQSKELLNELSMKLKSESIVIQKKMAKDLLLNIDQDVYQQQYLHFSNVETQQNVQYIKIYDQNTNTYYLEKYFNGNSNTPYYYEKQILIYLNQKYYSHYEEQHVIFGYDDSLKRLIYQVGHCSLQELIQNKKNSESTWTQFELLTLLNKLLDLYFILYNNDLYYNGWSLYTIFVCKQLQYLQIINLGDITNNYSIDENNNNNNQQQTACKSEVIQVRLKRDIYTIGQMFKDIIFNDIKFQDYIKNQGTQVSDQQDIISDSQLLQQIKNYFLQMNISITIWNFIKIAIDPAGDDIFQENSTQKFGEQINNIKLQIKQELNNYNSQEKINEDQNTLISINKLFSLRNKEILNIHQLNIALLRRRLENSKTINYKLLTLKIILLLLKQSQNKEQINFQQNQQVNDEQQLKYKAIKLILKTQSQFETDQWIESLDVVNLERNLIKRKVNLLYGNLAGIYYLLGKNEKSITLYIQAIKLIPQSQSEKDYHKQLDQWLNTMGLIYYQGNRLDEALSLFNKAIQQRLKKQQQQQIKQDLFLAKYLGNFAKVLIDKEQYEMAEKKIDYAIKLIYTDQVLDQPIQNCIIILNEYLGFVQKQQKNYHQAKLSYHQAYQLAQKLECNNIIYQAKLLQQIALINALENKLVAAQDVQKQAISIINNLYGKQDLVLVPFIQQLGQLKIQQGNYKEAIEILRKALEIVKKNEDDESLIEIIGKLGDCFKNIGIWNSALQNYQQVIEILTKIKGENDKSTAIWIGKIANIQREKGDYTKSKENITKAISLIQGQDSVILAELIEYNGILLLDQGLVQEAKEQFEKAIELVKKQQSSQLYTYSLASKIGNLGSANFQLKKLKEAEEQFNQAIQLVKIQYGEKDLQLGTHYLNLGNLYISTQDYQKAETNIQLSLKIKLETYGESSPSLVSNYGNLGIIFQHRGDLNQSENFYLEAIRIIKSNYGNEHPTLAKWIGNLGNIFIAQKKLKEAEILLLKCIQLKKQAYGDNTYQISNELVSLGNIYQQQEQLPKAEEQYSLAINLITQQFGNDYLDLHILFINLGNVQRKLKKIKECIVSYKKAIKLVQKYFGKEHQINANYYSLLGIAFAEQNDYKKAEKYLIICTRIHGNKKNQYNNELINCHAQLAGVHCENKQYQSAINEYQKALNHIEKFNASDFVTLTNYYILIATVYIQMVFNKEAENYFNKALSFAQNIYKEEHPLVILIKLQLNKLKNLSIKEIKVEE